MRRIIHLSDLHFPADPARMEALAAAIASLKPDLTVITGDLTRAGRRREFRAARAFTDRLPKPLLIVPGNHDVPVYDPAQRLLMPFARFRRFFPGSDSVMSPQGDVVVGRLDTARGMSTLNWDWSLGQIGKRDLQRLSLAFAGTPQDALRIAACHHPLKADPADPRRSRTSGGAVALRFLGRLGVSILLHGHLHRTSMRLLPAGARQIISIGAGTLSTRERGAGASFNLITLGEGRAVVTEILWNGRDFETAQILSTPLAWEPSARSAIDSNA